MNAYLSKFGTSVTPMITEGDTHILYIENYDVSAIDNEDQLPKYCVPRSTYKTSDTNSTITRSVMRVCIPKNLLPSKEARCRKYRNLSVLFATLFVVCGVLHFVCGLFLSN